MRDTPTIAKLDRGLSFSDDPILAGSPSGGFLNVPIWGCQNYEINKNGGIALADAQMRYDGRVDIETLKIYIIEGGIGGTETPLLNPAGEPCSYGPGGNTSGYWASCDPEGGATPVKNQATYSIIFAVEGPLTYTTSPLVWESITINGVDVITTDPVLVPTKVWELDKSFFMSEGDNFGSDHGHGNSPPANVLLRARRRVISIMDGVYSATTGRRLPTTNVATGAFITGMFYHDYALFGVDASGFTSSEGGTLYKAGGVDRFNGWTAQDMGQEMSFRDGVFPIKYEDYISWEVSSGASFLLGGTSSSTELDYFPGLVAYHHDGTDEYWATVVHTYKARGNFAEGEFTDCEVATTVNIDLTDATSYDNGGTLDGYTLATNDRVLVHKQDNAEENGIWVVQASGVMVRATDLDVTQEAISGYMTDVTGGDTYEGKTFALLNVDDLSVGVSGLVWLETEKARGALTLYDVADRTSGGTLTTDGSTTFPLSAVWTEGNALNFTSGSTEPSIGDILEVFGDTTTNATVLKVILDYGTWAGGDASGTIIVGKIGNAAEFAVADQIDINGGDSDVLTVSNKVLDTDRDNLFTNSSVNVAVTLPSFEDVAAAGSKYQFVEHNFFATNDEGEKLQNPSRKTYVVNGAGLAFSFDGSHLIRIRTGRPTDTPRHVSIHGNRLALGYADGSVSMSVGGEPYNFSGKDGALDFGFTHKITGLVKMGADTTAVFTEKTISTLSGTNDQNMVSQDVSINSGAIEYTAVDMGAVIFCDRHGISSLQASASYGDFGLRPLSQRIDSWLLPRLRASEPGLDGVTTALTDPVRLQGSIDYALPVRGKGQYRLFFTDGEVLVGTILPDGRMEFGRHVLFSPRTQAYIHWQSCGVAAVSPSGTDVLYYVNNRPAKGYVFQLDAIEGLYGVGTSSDRDANIAWLVLGPIFPTMSQGAVLWNTVRIHGEYHGAAMFTVGAIGIDYINPALWEGTASTNDNDSDIESEDDPMLKVVSEFFGKITSLTEEEISVADGLQEITVGALTNPSRTVANYFFKTVEVPGRGMGLYILLFPKADTGETAETTTEVGIYPHRITSLALDIAPVRETIS